MTPVLAFDIETIPDAEMLRARDGFSEAVDDGEVVEMALRRHRQEKNSDFLPPAFHKIAVISCALRRDDEGAPPLNIFSLAPPEYDEAAAVAMFFKIIDKHTPQLASWNGGGFDLPLLHLRGLKHGVVARRYWQQHGADESGDKFRWNNYLSRFHERHLDLMDVLALHQPKSWSGLSDIARLCGLPGKMGMDGGDVWSAWREGRQEAVRRYCETDALLTYLLFVRAQHFRGLLPRAVAEEEKIVRDCLPPERWHEFLEAWPPPDKE